MSNNKIMSKRKRLYPIRENFFDKIDSEESAYFLGFLYSDGCNHGNYISLSLKSTDREILEKLSALIYLEDPNIHVKDYDRGSKGVSSTLNIGGIEFCNQLTKLGCHQRKTFTIRYPVWMDDSLHKHFIRGYFDGDGSIYVRGGSKSKFKITSCIEFSTSVAEVIEKFTGVKLYICRSSKTSTVYDAAVAGSRNCLKVLNWLYEGGNIFLERKYDKFLLLKKEVDRINELTELGTRGYPKRYLK